MNQGTVKFFNSLKGYGFIKNDETGDEIFVHISALKNGLKELNEGQKVTYEVEKDPKSNKNRAVNVELIN
ncbi:MAG: cold shock domain-containing protein [Bacilli bacterium]|nr:cold shock domain-containing protein [Bacilli bacterium]